MAANPKAKEYRLTHPANFRQMMKDLAKRDDPHLTMRNPYLYPARTFRLLNRHTEKAVGFGPYIYSQGLSKAGDKPGITIVHGQGKSI
jgi:hypothetical protein